MVTLILSILSKRENLEGVFRLNKKSVEIHHSELIISLFVSVFNDFRMIRFHLLTESRKIVLTEILKN